jgi:hypothetical protein
MTLALFYPSFLQVNVFELGHVYLQLVQALHLQLPSSTQPTTSPASPPSSSSGTTPPVLPPTPSGLSNDSTGTGSPGVEGPQVYAAPPSYLQRG